MLTHNKFFCGLVLAFSIETLCSTKKLPHLAKTEKLDQRAFYARNLQRCPREFQADCYLHAVLDIVNGNVNNSLYIVNIGANDGKTMDPLYEYFAAGASGLLVELDDQNFALLNANVPWDDRVTKVQQTITPANVGDVFLSHGVPRVPDILKIDIDSYDVIVVEHMLSDTSFRPKIIIMEINEKIPPPISFTINYYQPYSYKGDHCYGVSIEKAVSAANAHGYAAVALDWNNLILVDERHYGFRFDVLDKSTTSLYNTGYWNRKERASKFPWNADVDHWVLLAHDDVDSAQRAIFEFMIKTRSFQSKSSMTFEIGNDAAVVKHGYMTRSERT